METVSWRLSNTIAIGEVQNEFRITTEIERSKAAYADEIIFLFRQVTVPKLMNGKKFTFNMSFLILKK